MSLRAAAPPAAADTVAPDDRDLVEYFLERAWSELGLADNTLASNRLELEAFARWLGAHMPVAGSGQVRAVAADKLRPFSPDTAAALDEHHAVFDRNAGTAPTI